MSCVAKWSCVHCGAVCNEQSRFTWIFGYITRNSLNKPQVHFPALRSLFRTVTESFLFKRSKKYYVFKSWRMKIPLRKAQSLPGLWDYSLQIPYGILKKETIFSARYRNHSLDSSHTTGGGCSEFPIITRVLVSRIQIRKVPPA